MAVIVLTLAFALTVLAALVFVAVVVGIHSESHHRDMTTKPDGLLAAMVRRLLGVYVEKPADTDTAGDDRDECLTGNSTDWWNKGGWDE